MTLRMSKQIGIDAAHRLPNHGSKCRNLHGHRYEIEAVCELSVSEQNEHFHTSGMIMDFSFLKEEMMGTFDAPCDHGLILTVEDEAMLFILCPEGESYEAWVEVIRSEVQTEGYFFTNHNRLASKLYVIAHQPTAENLARHWFGRLQARVHARSEGLARLVKIGVWETPTSFAEYSPK